MAGVETVAHRGANNLAPENTRAAARACVDLGVDWLEIDVRSSRDGVLYDLHDRSVRRTTGRATSAPLSALTSEEIDHLDAGSWFSPEFSGERIPRVEELITELSGKIRFYFDVKDAALPVLIDLVSRHRLEEDSFFWFWNPLLALRFSRLAPHLQLKVNASTPAGARRARRIYGADLIECSSRALSEPLLAACHEAGMRLMVHTGANDPTAFRRIVEIGADLANIDYVTEFKSVRDAKSKESGV